MSKSEVQISIRYKDDSWDTFSIPADEAHAQEIVDIGAELGGYEGKPRFIALTNKNTEECLFVDLSEVRTVHMKTVVTE